MAFIFKETIGIVKNKSIVQSFEWHLKDFTSLKKGECVESPVFTTTCFPEVAQWKLRLYPYGDNAENEDELSLFIQSMDDKRIIADVTFSLLDDGNNKIKKRFLGESEFEEKQSWGLDLIERKSLFKKQDQLLVNNTLRILCEMCFNVKSIDSLTNNNSLVKSELGEHSYVPKYRLKAFDNMEKLLETGCFSDVTFTVDGNKIQAHKAIVASCSPVFEEQFQREKEQNIFDIPDMKYEVLKEMLRFMYTSKVNEIEEVAVELLIAAEKYSIPELKFLCERAIHGILKVENVFQYLEVAVKYNATCLKLLLVDFIATNQKSIVDKPEFNQFGNLPADLQCLIVRTLVAKNSSPSL